jgi:hypothetical protein
MSTYKLSTFPNQVIKDERSFIPFDPDNTDYQQYLAWLEAGNQPLPADEVTQ